MHNRLIITNGRSAVDAISASGVEGDMLAWNDVLHDGPVPRGLNLRDLSGVRSRFISALGWGDMEEVSRDFALRDAALETVGDRIEVICWFEHDLYDQLQLWQVLDALRHVETSVGLICRDRYIGYQSSENLLKERQSIVEVRAEDFASAARLWCAFREDNPEHLWNWRESSFSFASSAIHRWAQTYPDLKTGLNRSECFTLRFLSERQSKNAAFPELFSALLKQEEAQFMGDASLMIILERLASMAEPLIKLVTNSDARLTSITLTQAGESRLSADSWTWDPACDRWIGGVELNSELQWCFSRSENRFVNRAESQSTL